MTASDRKRFGSLMSTRNRSVIISPLGAKSSLVSPAMTKSPAPSLDRAVIVPLPSTVIRSASKSKSKSKTLAITVSGAIVGDIAKSTELSARAMGASPATVCDS